MMRIREFDSLKTVLVMYEQEKNRNLSKPSYQIEEHGKETYLIRRSEHEILRLEKKKLKLEYQ